MSDIFLGSVQSSTLKDIDDVQPLGTADYQVLKEVGDLLRKYRLTERFGICLLHKHFEYSDDEELVEETDTVNRVSTISVKPKGSQQGPSIETMWRFGGGVEGVTLCVRGCSYNNGHKSVHVSRGY